MQDRFCQNCGLRADAIPGLVCPRCKQHYNSATGTVAVPWETRLGALVLDVLLGIFTLFIGWFLWALIVTYKNGQTPGKSIIGIRVVRDTGEAAGWGLTFLREVVVKWILVGALNAVTFGLFWIFNYLWPLWDRNLQALHDKMVSTVVVREGVMATRSQQGQPGDLWASGAGAPPTAGAQ